MKTKTIQKIVLTVAALAMPMLANAANVSLNGNDAAGTTSYNAAGHWNNSQAPSAGNDYSTAGFLLRTPGDNANNVNYVFGGASLTLGPTAGTSGSMIEKFGGSGGQVRTETINNLTNAAGAMIRSGAAPATQVHIAGNHFTIAGNSTILGDQSVFIIDSPLLGADNVFLTNSCASFDHVEFNGTNSGFTGTLVLSAPPSGWWNLQLDNVNSLPGNPSAPNPGQILFYANGELHDVAGCSYTNSNGGITLAGNGVINASATTLIGVPITDLTNGVHSGSLLTSSGSGTLILSNANNTYSGGTVISAGTLQLGVDNALPGNSVGGDVTVTGTLDLNAHNAIINGLNGSGTVDTVAGGTPTLTVGANGDNGSFTGTIQNSSGTLTLAKIASGTQTLSGYAYSGNTIVAGGMLNLTSAGALPSTPGDLVVSNTGVLAVDASGGAALPANNLILATNGTLNLTLNPGAIGLQPSGNLTLQDNATINLAYGTLTANPTAAAIYAVGGISAQGSNIVINITATGLQPGTFTLINYTGTALASLANFHVSPPPGVAAILVNNTGNHSIDLQITAVPNVLTWNGVNGTTWNLSTPNWMNPATGGITVFQQYTNNGVVAGDAVTFDDTVTNDFVNPRPTNIVLNSTFYAFPVVVNTYLPYSIAGKGGIAGATSLAISNSYIGVNGSLTLLTSNSFTGGVNLAGGALIITNDSALGASSGAVTLNGGTLQFNGGVTNSRAFPVLVDSTIDVSTNDTVRLSGVVSGAGSFNINSESLNGYFNNITGGTLVLTAHETLTGNVFLHEGTTIFDSGFSLTNGNYNDVGQNDIDSATLTLQGTAAFTTTSDFNVGDLDYSSGILNVSGSASLTVNQFFIGSANASDSAASGAVNQSGGIITQVSTAVGAFAIGGRTSASGVGVYNMNGGTLTANAGLRVGGTGIGTLNQNGGTINALQGINIARIAGSFGTNNLNGGTLSTYNIGSSTGVNAVFNFNGGTLQANFNPGSPWFSTGIQANILAGGAFIDSSNNNVTINAPLLAGSPNGGLTKKGTGTLTLAGINTFTGPITNTAGTLVLSAPSTYSGLTVVNAGNVQVTSASSLAGGATINNGGVLTIAQGGAITENMGNMTLNGTAGTPGATLALAPTNTSAALVNCGMLTLNGTNTISLPVQNPGTVALIHYTSLAGSGNCTNLALPQGASGYISNSAPNSTIYAVITSTGPGIVWTGTNSAPGKLNLWDVNTTTNWLLGVVPTSYHQIVVPGDLVTFNDTGSGTVLVSNTVSPTSITISNTAKSYAFSGNGSISGPAGILKLGANVATLALANNIYTGNTVISNGTLQAGVANALPSAVQLIIGPSGVFDLNGFNSASSELLGSGAVVDNNGNDTILTVGSSAGGTWNGNIQYTGHGGVALHKVGTGTWIVGGPNFLNDGQSFTDRDQINQGTTIITNGGSLNIPYLQLQIASGAGQTAAVVVDGGSLTVTNNVLSVGYGDATANGTLIVNSGTVDHSGYSIAMFAAVANGIDVGAQGATGTLIVNGGQVLNDQPLYLGDGANGNGSLFLNGGLLRASVLEANGAPASSIANFNGGTLQAATNTSDFLLVTSMVYSNGLVLDDNGYSVTIASRALQAGDGFNGGLTKKGSGTVYLDSGNTYSGATVISNGVLAGTGSVAGSVLVASGGSIGAGDMGGIGSFTVNNNLTIQGGAVMRINRDGPANDQVIASGNAIYGGTLVVSNLSATALTTSDSFQLFSVTGTKSGNFSSIAGSPGTGLAYSFNPTSGVLSVVPFVGPTGPATITNHVSAGTLALSWPAGQGWKLQQQTNSLTTGLSTNWVYVTDGSVSSTNITIDATQPTVFYRLVYP